MQRSFRSFIKNGKNRKNAKNVSFFYKEWERTQRTLHSFLKNGKERKNVAFFWKERVPNPAYGKVLGVFFNTKDLSWSLPRAKSEKALKAIGQALASNSLTVKDFQSLTGRLNDIAQMSQFLKGFTHPINKCLGMILRRRIIRWFWQHRQGGTCLSGQDFCLTRTRGTQFVTDQPARL